MSSRARSPRSAARASCCNDELPEHARREFSGQVLAQSGRMQALVDRMLELTKLEQRHAQVQRERLSWAGVLQSL
jgi:two-component system sensor histidine kinase CreC